MENRDARRARRHLRRAHELLDFGLNENSFRKIETPTFAARGHMQYEFGGPEKYPLPTLYTESKHKQISDRGEADFILKTKKYDIDLMIRPDFFSCKILDKNFELIVVACFTRNTDFIFGKSGEFKKVVETKFKDKRYFEFSSFKKFKTTEKSIGKEMVMLTLRYLLHIKHINEDDVILVLAEPTITRSDYDEKIDPDREKLIKYYEEFGFKRHANTEFMYASVADLFVQ